jgi:hypothetical protein
MPNYEAHKKIGFIISLVVSLLIILFSHKSIQLTTLQWILVPLVIIFYSNLPDIDHHMGRLRKRTFMIIFTLMVLSSIVVYFVSMQIMLITLTIIGVLGLTVLKLKHRGIMHTYPFVLIASLPMLLIHWFLFVIALSSSSSHIFIDRLFSKTKRKAKKFFGMSGKIYNINLKL